MAYSQKEIDEIFDSVLVDIENGMPLRQILKNEGKPSSQTFYNWLENDESKSKRYARACETRADAIFDEIIEIADDKSNDEVITENGISQNSEFIARSRVRIDARKWVVSKLNPKKYGDKIDLTTDGEKIQQVPPIEFTILKK